MNNTEIITRRIGVWNTAFLGDAILTLPLLQSLKLHYPDADIDFYVRGGFAPLFTPHPALASVIAHDKRGSERGVGGILRLAKHIAEQRYDLWITAHGSGRSSVMALSSKASIRIGYSDSMLNRLCCTNTVDRCFTALPEIERLLRLLRPLDIVPDSTWPNLVLDPAAAAKAEAFFATAPGPVLGIHPGSVWPTKRWPESYFAEIGRRALELGATVLLFASSDEQDIARSVMASFAQSISADRRHGLIDLTGKLTLAELAAYVGRVSCYVTNDSGPMHLAWVQHTPVTSLFGPTVQSLGFFPRGESSTVFELPLQCRPCGLHGHRHCPLGHHNCMVLLEPDCIWPDVRAKLLGAVSK